MEREQHTTPEQDDIRIYQGLVERVLMERGMKDETLSALTKQFTVPTEMLKDAVYMGVDVGLIDAVIEELRTRALELTNDAVDDIRQTVFVPNLFTVRIVSEGESHDVQDIECVEGSVYPVISDQSYRGAIDRVIFDR